MEEVFQVRIHGRIEASLWISILQSWIRATCKQFSVPAERHNVSDRTCSHRLAVNAASGLGGEEIRVISQSSVTMDPSERSRDMISQSP